MSKRRWVTLMAPGLAVVLLGALLWFRRQDLAIVGDLEVSWPVMIGAIALTVVATFLSFVRWFYLVRAQGIPFSLFDALRLGLIGVFFNFLVPGAVGGDLVKAALMAREQKKRLLAVSTIVVDRVVGLLGLLILTGVLAIATWSTVRESQPLTGLARWNLSLLGLAVAALLVFMLWRWPLESLAAKVRNLPAVGPLLASVIEAAASYQGTKGTVLGCVLLSVLIQVLFVGSLLMGGIAIWPEVPRLGSYLVAIPFGLLSTAIPVTPGGLGVAEVTLEALFSYVGAPASYALLMMLGFRLGQVATVGLGVMLYFGSREIRRVAHDVRD